MVQGKQQQKFERNPCIRNRDNCDKDGRRTDADEFRFMSSADIAFFFQNNVQVFGPAEATIKIWKKSAY